MTKYFPMVLYVYRHCAQDKQFLAVASLDEIPEHHAGELVGRYEMVAERKLEVRKMLEYP